MSMFESAMFIELIEQAQKACHKNSVDHGFWDEGVQRFIADGCMGTEEVLVTTKPWCFAEKIALIHSELSEALEKHRKGDAYDGRDEHCPGFRGVEIEFADAVIRIFDLAEKMGFNMGRAILAKMSFNKTRPHKHGKQY